MALRRAVFAERADGAAAVTAYGKFVQRYPQPVAEAIEARQKLLDIAAKNGNAAERKRWQKEIVTADAGAGAERNDRTRYLAAKSQLVLATRARRVPRHEARDPARQEPQGEAGAHEGRARRQYGKAGGLRRRGGHDRGELRDRGAVSLAEQGFVASERPRELKKDELEQYNVLLEEQAFPFEEQAIKLHEVNAARTVDGFYDEWVQKSLAALVELMPARYAKPEIGESLVAAIR